MYFKEINGKDIKDDLFSIRDSQLEKEMITPTESVKNTVKKEKVPKNPTKKSSDKTKKN